MGLAGGQGIQFLNQVADAFTADLTQVAGLDQLQQPAEQVLGAL